MINLNDKKIRQELVRRYLNAETTLEEERLLADFLSNPNIVLSTEEENVLLLLQSSSLIGIADISSEKADEFDRLTQCGHSKRQNESKTGSGEDYTCENRSKTSANDKSCKCRLDR